MANDHDKHTCGCSDCNAAYNQRYYGSDSFSKTPLNDYSAVELKNELVRRANERKEKIKKAKIEIEARRKKAQEDYERNKDQIDARRNKSKILAEIQALANQIEELKQRLS